MQRRTRGWIRSAPPYPSTPRLLEYTPLLPSQRSGQGTSIFGRSVENSSTRFGDRGASCAESASIQALESRGDRDSLHGEAQPSARSCDTPSVRFVESSTSGQEMVHLDRPAIEEAIRGHLCRSALSRERTLHRMARRTIRIAGPLDGDDDDSGAGGWRGNRFPLLEEGLFHYRAFGPRAHGVAPRRHRSRSPRWNRRSNQQLVRGADERPWPRRDSARRARAAAGYCWSVFHQEL